jgi:hypothetical protein
MENRNVQEGVIRARRVRAFQNESNSKWTDELTIANRQLVFQIEDRDRRVAEFLTYPVEAGIYNR